MIDVAAVCRICLQDSESNMVSIFERDTMDRSLCEKIENCCDIKINNTTDFPAHICLKCRAFLNLAHKFRQICRRSDDFLREFVHKDPQDDDNISYEQLEVLDEELWVNDEVNAPVEISPIFNTAPDADKIPNATAVSIVIPPSRQPTSDAQKRKHICDTCGNSYPRKSTLETHMRRHRNERPYECEICHKAFHVNYQLMRHIRQHTGARPYRCQYCHRSFSERTGLVKHERIHRNERPYCCKICGKTFTYASVLKMHHKTHTGEKPHCCKLCDKRFARNHNLLAHLQTQQHLNDPRMPEYLQELKAGQSSQTP